jgi:hypothetical protein
VPRKELDRVLSGEGAHIDFAPAVEGWPVELRGVRHGGMPHSAWELLEHLRIAQWDMLEFSRDARHVSPAWPEGYWPGSALPPDDGAWERSVAAFEADRAAMRALVMDAGSDLFAPFAHGEGQNLLREALQMADHNAYHVGQLMSLRRGLGIG